MYNYLMHFGQIAFIPNPRELNKVHSYMTSYPPDMGHSSSFSEYPNPTNNPKSTGKKHDDQDLPQIG